MEHDFQQWIQKYRVTNGGKFTHTGMHYFKGKFNIPEFAQDEFIEKYYQHTIINNRDCDLIERHVTLCCLLFDLDIKIGSDVTERGYSQEAIREFIKNTIKIVNRYFEVSNVNAFDAYVLEKQAPTKKSAYQKDGVHIVFPFLIVETALNHFIRNELLVASEDLFPLAQNSIDDIIDISIIEQNGWMMYGSKKKGGFSYDLTGVWGYREFTDIDDNMLPISLQSSHIGSPSVELVSLMSIRRFTMADMTSVRSDMRELLDCWINEFNANRKEKEEITLRKYQTTVHFDNSKPDLNTVEQLVDILDVKRASSYTSWIETGWCLHNIDESLFKKWVEFSERDPNYSAMTTECAKRWSTMQHSGLGLGTLHMWAKADSPTEYDEIVRNDLEYLICKTVCSSTYTNEANVKRHSKQFVSNLVYHVVNVLKQKYGHYYICSSFKHKAWYEFNGLYWDEDDSDIGLRTKIREKLYTDFDRTSRKFKRLSMRLSNDHPNKKKYEIMSSEIEKVSTKLRDHKFRTKLCDEAAEQLHWSHLNLSATSFEEVLDTKTHLIGMKNGVFDLKTGTFRESRCEDFISLNTNIEFCEFTWSDPIVLEIQCFLSTILPDGNVRNYVLRVLSSCLDGQTRHEHFHLWAGTGGNGKSKLIELFELAFGQYCSKLSVAAITQKRAGSNAPTPEIARLRGKRFVVLQEPNENESLQVGVMKELTGGDRIIARSLNKEPIEFKPQFTMILTCNELPKVPPDDGGTWRRIRLVRFNSQFVENPDPTNPREFKIDPELNEKLHKWKFAFFWMLTEVYKQYIKNGFIEPEEVKKYTNEYQAMNDLYSDFIHETIKKDENSYILVDELHAIFKDWHNRNIGSRCPTKKQFTAHLEKKLSKTIIVEHKKAFNGIKMVL